MKIHRTILSKAPFKKINSEKVVIEKDIELTEEEIKNEIKNTNWFFLNMNNNYSYKPCSQIELNNKITILMGSAGSGKTKNIKKYIKDNQDYNYIYISCEVFSMSEDVSMKDHYQDNSWIYYDHKKHNAEMSIIGASKDYNRYAKAVNVPIEIEKIIKENISVNKKNILIIEDFTDINIMRLVNKLSDYVDKIIVTSQYPNIIELQEDLSSVYICQHKDTRSVLTIPANTLKKRIKN